MKTVHLKRKRSWLRPSKRHCTVCNRFMGLTTWIYHQRLHKRLQTTTPSVAMATTSVLSLPTGYRAMVRTVVRTLFPFLCMEAPTYFLRHKLGRSIPLIPRKMRDYGIVIMKTMINMVKAEFRTARPGLRCTKLSLLGPAITRTFSQPTRRTQYQTTTTADYGHIVDIGNDELGNPTDVMVPPVSPISGSIEHSPTPVPGPGEVGLGSASRSIIPPVIRASVNPTRPWTNPSTVEVQLPIFWLFWTCYT